MEESEKRRERLRAMRMEAAQVDATGNGNEPALPSYLSNPLIENSATTLNQAEECSTARFDFYTDPMAAFSSSKKKSNDMPPRCSGFRTSQILSNCAGTSNPESTPPAPQFQRNHLQGPRHNSSSTPYGSPARTARPFPMNQATSMAGQCYQPHPGPSPDSGWSDSAMHGWAPRLGHSTSPQSNPRSSPGLGRGNWHGSHTRPSAGLDRGPTFVWAPQQSQSPIPRSGYPGILNPSPRPGLDRGPTIVRAPRPSQSPIPQSGYPGSSNPSPCPRRGQGNWSGTRTSPGSEQWVSLHGHGSRIVKSSRVEGFYDESMLEDPWKFLEPVLWKNVNHSSKFRDLELKSLAAKRPRASESWSQSSFQPSLAEYLAASFNEVVDRAPSR